MRTRSLATLAFALVLTLTACSKSTQAADGSTGGNPAANGSEGFEGNLVTSGGYSATWTVAEDAPADVFNSSSHVTLTSDHGTFGNLRVQPDGSVSFGSAAPELASNMTFNGAGAQVTMDETNRFVCAFSVDIDLIGARDGATLHIKGNLAVQWHPQGIGDANCP